MSRFGMRSLNRLFSHFFWFNLSAFRLASPPGGMRLPPEGEPCQPHQTLALTPPVLCPREPRPGGEPCTTYYDFELFCLFVRFSTGCRARSPGKSGRGPAPGSSVHYPAVPSDARRRGAAGSARKAARTGSISRGRFFHHPRIYGERALFFCGEIMTQRPATAGPAAAAAAAAVHRACYNQLSTTLQRYRAQQQQATPCACDRSALYCVELLWKAPEIHHPSHLLVPEVYLGCCWSSSASFGTTPRYM